MRISNYIYRAIAAALMACTLVLASCAVHEWPKDGGEPVIPEPPKYPVILYLDYDTDLPLYKVIEYQLESRSAMAVDYDVRYIIEVYTVEDEYLGTKKLYSREMFTRDDVNTLNHSQQLNLPEGKYEFYVWTDYVDAGTTGPKYYLADDITTITVQNHEGNNDFRDAYAGVLKTEITPLTTEVRVMNRRPLAKFSFVTTDLDRFIEHMLELEAQAKAESEPNEFDIFSYIPIYALPNISFESEITPISDTEAELGFDYVFVNGEEFIVPIIVEVYDKEGKKVSGINPIDVPLMRGQLTIVRDNFLTSQASGGIGINPDFEDPDYIFEVN